MYKKFLAVLMAAAIASATILTGCSSDGGSSETSSGNTSETSSEESSEPASLNILKAEAQHTPVWEALIEKYQEDHPNVDIEIEAYDNDLWTVLKTRLNSGECPDIFTTFPYADTKVYGQYCLDLTGEDFLSEIDSSTMDSVSLDGKVLGVCLYGDAIGMVYNKDMFDQAGITELPTTMDELEAVCKTLADQGITPISNGYKEYWVFKDILVHYLASEEGTPEEVANKLTSGELTFSDMKYVPQVFDYIDLSLQYGADKPLETGYTDQVNAIATGKTAMTAQGNWIETEVKAIDPEANLGFFPIPVGNDPDKSKLMVGPAWAYHIGKDTEYPEAAKDFIGWLVSSEEGKRFLGEDIGKMPLVKDAPLVGNLNTEAQQYMEEGKTYPLVQYYWPSGGFETAQGETFQKYIDGSLTREQCLEQFTADWQKLVTTAE